MSLYQLGVVLVSLVNPSKAAPLLRRVDSTDLDCAPNSPFDILTFFVLNYLAHAGTIPAKSGPSWREDILRGLVALLSPYFALTYALTRMLGLAEFGKVNGEFSQAARDDTAVVLQRTKTWRPRLNEQIPGLETPDERIPGSAHWGWDHAASLGRRPDSIFSIRHKTPKIHGSVPTNLYSHGYELALLPADALFSSTNGKVTLASTTNVAGSVSGLAQIMFACYTLYNTSGPQLAQFGYAAYGFTVLPYLTMSFVNTSIDLCTTTYPKLFLVRSEVMHEAEQRGLVFDGVIGEIAIDQSYSFGIDFIPPAGRINKSARSSTLKSCLVSGYYTIFLVAACLPVTVVGAMSYFQNGSSSIAELILVISWISGPPALTSLHLLPRTAIWFRIVVGLLPPACITIAGMVVVGIEMTQSVNCVKRP